MSLSSPQTIFGVHSATLYRLSDFVPYGTIKVLGSLSFDLTGDFVDLFGGSNRYIIDSEAGNIDAGLTGTIKEIPNFMFELFVGGSATQNVAEPLGNVGTIANHAGTSVVNATTGIASAAADSGNEADLKTAIYTLVATGANTVDVYAMSDVDFNQGTDLEFIDDTLKIASGIVIPDTGGTVVIPNTGIELTGGSGTVALTSGDSAVLYTRKVNSGSDIIDLGTALQEFPEFGMVITSQKKSNGDIFETQIFRAKGIGLPLGMTEKEWLESDINVKALFCANKQKVATIRRIRGAGANIC